MRAPFQYNLGETAGHYECGQYRLKNQRTTSGRAYRKMVVPRIDRSGFKGKFLFISLPIGFRKASNCRKAFLTTRNYDINSHKTRGPHVRKYLHFSGCGFALPH